VDCLILGGGVGDYWTALGLFVGVSDSSANTETGKHQAFGAVCSKRLH
jgi:hypothetical protein